MSSPPFSIFVAVLREMINLVNLGLTATEPDKETALIISKTDSTYFPLIYDGMSCRLSTVDDCEKSQKLILV
ncbi:MAG TPA: hypothetical protein VE548_11795 [Nitrososphaeraceae archaeon]|nr:hypothetical protein [Nitrososphaeraceae archaeon]